MIPLTLQDAALICGGSLAVGEATTAVRGVSIDSRAVWRGDLFVGVRGERLDGGSFAAAALAAGALAVVVDPASAAALPSGAPHIVVADGLAALQALAAAVRRRSSARVVAITGSTGKTSTKDILAALLRPLTRVAATSGNYNNEIGVPLTLLSITPETEVCVSELAMRGHGQIRELARLTRPDVGVITNIAPVHLELVGDLAGVAAAKAELVEELGAGSVVVPAAEPLLAPYLARYRGRVVTFSEQHGDIALVEMEREGDGTRAVVDAYGHRASLRFNFTGEHYLMDALAALGAFLQLGYSLGDAREGARQIVFSQLRGELVTLPGGGLLLNDAYNSNPLAARAAVEHLLQLAAGRPPVAILGDMYELGPESARYHAELGAFVAARNVRLVAVGELARGLLTGAEGERWFATVEECLAALPSLVPPGSVVLVKASRALRLERVAQALKERTAGRQERGRV